MKKSVPTRLLSGARHDVAYWGLLALACVVMLVMNVLTPFKEDDMGFTLIDGVWRPVRTLGDFLLSCRNHYVGTNGRLSDLVPALFAAFLGKGVFNVCNALVFGLLAYLLSVLSTGRRSITVVAMFLAVVGTCYPVPGETMLWMAGSANYLWAITASLLLVCVLHRRCGKPLGYGEAALLLLGSLVAGGCNEATGFGFFGGLVLYYAFNRSRFDRRSAVTLLGYLAGLLLIVASPAAWSRAAADGGIVTNLPLGDLLGARWYIFHEKVWRFYLPIVAVVVGLIALLLRQGRTVRRSVWTYIFICMALVMFALGLRHERAYAPWATVAFLIIAAGIDRVLSRWPWLRVAAVAVSLALAAFTFGRGVKKLIEYRSFDRQVVSEIVAAPSQAVIQGREFGSYSRFIKPMNYQSENFFGHEAVYRAYYGKRNVQFVSDSVYVRYHAGRLLDGARPLTVTCDRPDVLGAAWIFPDQNYMVVELLTDTLPATAQTARYLHADPNLAISPAERERQRNYGIRLDYVPMWFYPLEYQGRNYLICGRPGTFTTAAVFPVGTSPDEADVTLTFDPDDLGQAPHSASKIAPTQF